ncbi:hypothetical protein CLOP_g1987 [Closterium sp. NIES-67]|nr:hypothetical protein CLOP_g1987 [Closterium sp. NIES-67]
MDPGVLDDIDAMVKEQERVVTAKFLSRSLSLPLRQAKSVLQGYWSQHKEEVAAVWVVSGWVGSVDGGIPASAATPAAADVPTSSAAGGTAGGTAGGAGTAVLGPTQHEGAEQIVKEFRVRLVPSARLSETQEAMGGASAHIYSVQRRLPRDLAVLCADDAVPSRTRESRLSAVQPPPICLETLSRRPHPSAHITAASPMPSRSPDMAAAGAPAAAKHPKREPSHSESKPVKQENVLPNQQAGPPKQGCSVRVKQEAAALGKTETGNVDATRLKREWGDSAEAAAADATASAAAATAVKQEPRDSLGDKGGSRGEGRGGKNAAASAAAAGAPLNAGKGKKGTIMGMWKRSKPQAEVKLEGGSISEVKQSEGGQGQRKVVKEEPDGGGGNGAATLGVGGAANAVGDGGGHGGDDDDEEEGVGFSRKAAGLLGRGGAKKKRRFAVDDDDEEEEGGGEEGSNGQTIELTQRSRVVGDGEDGEGEKERGREMGQEEEREVVERKQEGKEKEEEGKQEGMEEDGREATDIGETAVDEGGGNGGKLARDVRQHEVKVEAVGQDESSRGEDGSAGVGVGDAEREGKDEEGGKGEARVKKEADLQGDEEGGGEGGRKRGKEEGACIETGRVGLNRAYKDGMGEKEKKVEVEQEPVEKEAFGAESTRLVKKGRKGDEQGGQGDSGEGEEEVTGGGRKRAKEAASSKPLGDEPDAAEVQKEEGKGEKEKRIKMEDGIEGECVEGKGEKAEGLMVEEREEVKVEVEPPAAEKGAFGAESIRLMKKGRKGVGEGGQEGSKRRKGGRQGGNEGDEKEEKEKEETEKEETEEEGLAAVECAVRLRPKVEAGGVKERDSGERRMVWKTDIDDRGREVTWQVEVDEFGNEVEEAAGKAREGDGAMLGEEPCSTPEEPEVPKQISSRPSAKPSAAGTKGGKGQGKGAERRGGGGQGKGAEIGGGGGQGKGTGAAGAAKGAAKGGGKAAGKGAPKKGQGSIMSFFQKRT